MTLDSFPLTWVGGRRAGVQGAQPPGRSPARAGSWYLGSAQAGRAPCPGRSWLIPCLVASASLLLAVEAAAGPLIVRTVPPTAGLQVLLNGAAAGTTAADGTCLVDGLAAGSYRVELVLPDGRGLAQDAVITLSALATQVRFAVGAAARKPDACRLLVSGNVGNATVEVDGQVVGRAGSADGSLLVEVAPGTRRVRVAADGYEPQERIVSVQSGPVNRLNVELRRTAAVQSRRSGATSSLVTWALVGILGVAVVAVAVVVVHLARQPERITTRRIDRYEVQEVLGRGGMATVYRARDTLDRGAEPVALKVLDEAHLRDPDLVHKFLREGQVLQEMARRDPAAPLVEVRHYGRAGGDSGVPFIAMELVEGEDLLKLLRRRHRLPLREAAHLVAGVARALQPAHAMGVYHRDLTPDNVILTERAKGGFKLRLIDFGVARHEYTSHGTLDGSIAGKPPFMSPEQCQGQPVDGRSDIYSLGIMLYTLLVGEPPFVSRNPLEVMRMHKETAVRFPAEVPDAAVLVLERALAKDREKRQRDITVLLEELRTLERLG